MRGYVRILSLSLAVGVSAAIAAPSDIVPESVLAQVRSASLDRGRAIRVVDLELDLGRASLLLEEGVFFPALPVAGRSREGVFVGRARFRLDPPDAVETHQLHQFTGQRRLSVEIERVVLCAGNEALLRSLLARPEAGDVTPQQRKAADQVFDLWTHADGHRPGTVDHAIVRAVLGDALYRDWFAVWCHSPELESFLYELAPTEYEPVVLSALKARPDSETAPWKETLWLTAALQSDTGEARHGSSGLESTHYRINATLTPDRQRLDARVTVEVVAEMDGLRFGTFRLMDGMKIRSVTDGSGLELEWLRSKSEAYVVFPEPTRAGQALKLTFQYGGEALSEIYEGVYRLKDTANWYPRTDGIDRATYHLQFNWPEELELLASGETVDRQTKDGQHIEVRRLTIPVLGVSFEIGRFFVFDERTTHVDIRIGISMVEGRIPKAELDDVRLTVKNALAFYEGVFGRYPLDELTVVTVPERRFSQGYLSFVTVAHTLVDRPGLSVFGNDSLGRPKRELRIETIAHEVAHQWWGNRVGWLSYRDQWLSEALAEYSAVQFVSRISESAALRLARRARIWREALDDTLEDGRTISSLGPVALGTRLFYHSPRAYSAIVYDKGSVVFTMLASLLGEEPFLEMLRVLAARVDNRVIDTETFIKALEHMSGRDLGDFVDRYVYGTGFPSIFYDYRIVRAADGSWVVEGEAHALDVDRSHYQLVHGEVDGWNLRRLSQERVDAGDLELPVPFQVVLADRDGEGKGKGTRRGLGGMMTIRGDGTRFSIPIDREPSEFWLDQKGEMLANFFCETRHPKQMMRRRANEMLRAGRREEAHQLFERALAAPTVAGPAAQELDRADIDWESRHQTVTIHLGLARLHLDEGDIAGARREMEAAEALLDRNSNFELSTRLVLRSWFEILEGRFKPAYDALSDYLRIKPREKKQDLEQVAPQMREQHRDADAYALLAVAAYETGHRSVAEKALKAARDRQADMSALAVLLSNP